MENSSFNEIKEAEYQRLKKLYGNVCLQACGTPDGTFYKGNIELAEQITKQGREILNEMLNKTKIN